MGVGTYQRPWEHSLLAMAQDAWQPLAAPTGVPVHDPRLLDLAYRYCDSITYAGSRSFHLASAFLPESKRRAVRALYAFCRSVDDAVDACEGDPRGALAEWRRTAANPYPSPTDLLAVAWAYACALYRIPSGYVDQLLDGVERDLRQTRYASFEELAGYAYGVASTVGLMSMHIIGFAGPPAIPYAIKLGVAMQVTNILRDVAEDLRLGRVYLPQDELAAHGLSEGDLAAGVVDDRWRGFMRFQIARNRRLYVEAWPGIALLDGDGRFAVAAAGELYRGILDDIEARDYDVFHHRAHLSSWDKLTRLPGVWWRNR